MSFKKAKVVLVETKYIITKIATKQRPYMSKYSRLSYIEVFDWLQDILSEVKSTEIIITKAIKAPTCPHLI